MKTFKTFNGNTFYMDGVFAFIEIGGARLAYWESEEELHNWVDLNTDPDLIDL